jgi:hypothetical protein
MNTSISFVGTVACLLLAGCSSTEVNPAVPRANTGYVDFYTDSSMDLSWEVKRAGANGGEMQTVYSKYKPVEGTILRLASLPGTYQFQVWVSNRATEGPQTVVVQVAEGSVTPVHVTLTPAGTTSVASKVYGFRPSAKGYGRGTKITTDENDVFKIGADAASPQAYQPRERMPYFSPAAK